ncbi:MAG: transaldolase family protein [Anaerolineae bacterium]|nr:transaldolase family protein [Anaerolineae bacterium]
MFRTVYENSNKRDGYVSLEVSPLLSDNTENTIAEAKRLFAAVNAPI